LNWSEIGVVAELIGALGVDASLAYVAQQVRQNTRTCSCRFESHGYGATESRRLSPYSCAEGVIDFR
jgi:hypothetical protein